MRRSQPKRDWTAARAKCDAEGCRLCGLPAEASHVIGREHDKSEPVAAGEAFLYAEHGTMMRHWKPYSVHPDRIVPLCGPTPGGHHGQYDRGELDLSPYLTLPEQLQAVADAGSIHLALRRIQGRAYEPAPREEAVK